MNGFAEEKSPAYRAPMTKAEFLAWVQEQVGRYELKDGQIVMHAGGTRNHARIIGWFISALNARLDPRRWAVYPTEIAVEIGNDIRYPDVVVERATTDGQALSTSEPVLLIEVLSRTSFETDMNVKLAEYTSLPSLEAYIVASQDEPLCRVWQRHGEERDFPQEPHVIKGGEAVIALPALAISLPLSVIYRNIVTP